MAEFVIDSIDDLSPAFPGFIASFRTTSAPVIEGMLGWRPDIGVTEWWVFDATHQTTALWACDQALALTAVEAVLQFQAGSGPRTFSWSPSIQWGTRTIGRDPYAMLHEDEAHARRRHRELGDVDLVARVAPGSWSTIAEAGS